MIKGSQVRAARALLGWDGNDLVAAVGLHRDTILNVETNKKVRGATADRIVQVFNDHGIEFIGDRGVAFLPENYRILEGDDCYLRLLEEVYQTLHKKETAEALFICVDDEVSTAAVVEANNKIRDAGIKCRYLSSENARKFDFPLEDYRVIPPQFYTNSVMVVFGNKVATLRDAHSEVMVIADKYQSDMLRGLFEMIWRQSPKPSLKTTVTKTKAKK